MYGVSRHRKRMITWTKTNIVLNSISKIVTSHHYDRIPPFLFLFPRNNNIAGQMMKYRAQHTVLDPERPCDLLPSRRGLSCRVLETRQRASKCFDSPVTRDMGNANIEMIYHPYPRKPHHNRAPEVRVHDMPH